MKTLLLLFVPLAAMGQTKPPGVRLADPTYPNLTWGLDTNRPLRVDPHHHGHGRDLRTTDGDGQQLRHRDRCAVPHLSNQQPMDGARAGGRAAIPAMDYAAGRPGRISHLCDWDGDEHHQHSAERIYGALDLRRPEGLRLVFFFFFLSRYMDNSTSSRSRPRIVPIVW